MKRESLGSGTELRLVRSTSSDGAESYFVGVYHFGGTYHKTEWHGHDYEEASHSFDTRLEKQTQ